VCRNGGDWAPNQEITAWAERGFGVDVAFPWASVRRAHKEAWLQIRGQGRLSQLESARQARQDHQPLLGWLIAHGEHLEPWEALGWRR
jgi:hypothetical protein